MHKRPALKKFHSFTHQEITRLHKRAHYIFRDSRLTMRAATAAHPPGRLLIVIPKRVGNAVRRNLIRRRIKSVFQENTLYQKGYDFILSVRRGGSDLSFSDIRTRMLNAVSSLQSGGRGS